MNYANNKKWKKVKYVVKDIILFPVRCVCTPIYKLSQRLKKNKVYSEKQIRKVVQYLLDYWTDGEKEFYVLIDDDYNPFDYSDIQNVFHMCFDINWSHKSIKKKAMSMYSRQKDQLISMFKKLCGEPMTIEEKKQYFNVYEANKIKDRIVCKLK